MRVGGSRDLEIQRRCRSCMLDRMDQPRALTAAKAIGGFVLMAAGIIGLPSISADLAQWPPIIAQVLDFLSGQLGRWIIFGIGVALFWWSVTSYVSSRLAARPTQDGLAQPQVGHSLPVPPPATVSTNTETKPTVVEPDRILVNVAPFFLIDTLKEHTDIAGQKLIAPYIGKWMRVEGSVADVVDASGNPYVQVWTDEPHRELVSMRFRPSWLDHLSTFRRGDRIVAMGRVASADTVVVRFEDCELVL